MKTVARKLREARQEREMSQEDVAKLLGLTSVAYGDFERERTEIGINYLIQLSRIFSKPIVYFLDIQPETNPMSLDEMDLLQAYRQLPTVGKSYALGIVKSMTTDVDQL